MLATEPSRTLRLPEIGGWDVRTTKWRVGGDEPIHEEVGLADDDNRDLCQLYPPGRSTWLTHAHL